MMVREKTNFGVVTVGANFKLLFGHVIGLVVLQLFGCFDEEFAVSVCGIMEDKSRRVCELCGQSFSRTAYYAHRKRQKCLSEPKKCVQTRLRNQRGSKIREGLIGEVAAGGNEGDQLDLFMCPGESCGFSYTSFKSLQGHYHAGSRRSALCPRSAVVFNLLWLLRTSVSVNSGVVRPRS
ncbi:MAG: hypothetical protein GY820_26750 [Gammaproteobacteria bacterium]|nr:hypothetical protein [Gammaproteobacteria bacterium]